MFPGSKISERLMSYVLGESSQKKLAKAPSLNFRDSTWCLARTGTIWRWSL